MNRLSRRYPTATEFARDQRACANEFSHNVRQMVRGRRCRNQKFRREYSIPLALSTSAVSHEVGHRSCGDEHQTEEGRCRDRNLHTFDSRLNQATRQQATLAERCATIGVADSIPFACQFKRG